ncbi:hypothetical protein NIES2101_06085 [Calothrix sp. HK-06]|nr:hypothetical protein NIES2101_06085 [Calothrix sp. HK-06]
MKRNFNKVIGASVLAASLSILPLSMGANAQSTTDGSSGTSTTQTTTGVNNDGTYRRDKGFDWGWLGLLGLAGLAGLAGKKRSEPTAYRDPNAVGTSGYRE